MSTELSNRSTPGEKQDPEKEVTAAVGNIIEIPDGGYGWFVCAGVFFLNFGTWAANSGYSIYLANYLKNDRFSDAGRLDYAAIGGLAFGSGLVMGPLVRVLLRVSGIRTVIAAGALLQFTGTILAAFSTKLWEVYLTQGVMIGIGMGMICVPGTTLLAQWFRKKRSTAQALSAAGSGVGGVVFNLAVESMIKHLSLRWALIIQSIICAVCNVIGVVLVRPRDKHIQISMKVWEFKMFSYPGYWLMLFYISTTLLGYVVILYSMSDFTISLGYSSHQGSVVACMVSVGIIFGRPAVGKLCDTFGTITAGIFAQLVVAIFCWAMWIPARNLATAIVFSLIAGGLMGTIWVSLPAIGARVVGLRKLDVAMSMAWCFIGAFGMVSPIIGLQLRSSPPQGQSHSPLQYRDPAIYCGMVYFASSMTLWVLRGYLIARDKEAKQLGSHVDNEEADLPVSISNTLKGMFSLSEERKV